MTVTFTTNEAFGISLEILRRGSPGITSAFGTSMAEAASVCLAGRGHSSPTSMPVRGAVAAEATVEWEPPTEQACRCWDDPDVATEHGAYGVAALLIPAISDLHVIERSRKGTGFDYWLGRKGDPGPLFQGRARLEVSGILSGNDSAVSTRLNQKLRQTDRSRGSLPAVVVIVEFGGPQSRVAPR
jgi:hypothetical protein